MVTGGTGRETVIIPCKNHDCIHNQRDSSGRYHGLFLPTAMQGALFLITEKMRWRTCWRKSIISVTDKVSYMTQLGQSTATSQIVRNNIHSGEDYLQVGAQQAQYS